MEFYPHALGAGISIDVLNTDSLRHELDDFYKAIKLIDFDYLNDLLLKEFNQILIYLAKKFGILLGKPLEGESELMNQHLRPSVLNWNFNGIFRVDFNSDKSLSKNALNLSILKDGSDVLIQSKSVIGVPLR